MAEIDFKAIESKWQKKWEEGRIFEANEDSQKEKFYVLEMFPYPSGDGLHMGHALNYSIGDVFARYKRMKGKNVIYPMGYDALGLPAENAAIKASAHPQDYTDKSIENFTRQFKSLGISYDWKRMVNTADSDYYQWDQWIFLKMFEKGLAYQKESSVNWCPECNTVLANEQVHNGKCWRHEDTNVEIKKLKQWFLKISDYADELYESIDDLKDWPEKTKAMQKNWIGKSHGVEIDFEISGEKWPVFTTRPDTLYGVTFVVVAAQHPKLMEIVTEEEKSKVEEFLSKIKTVSQKSMKDVDELNKEGVFTGAYAVNPINGEEVPVYAGNFVVADYGSGMVMAVPAHDKRDFLFAKKYNIPIKQVIAPLFEDEGKDMVREDKETVKRDAVVGIVKHWNEEKYFCLDWKKFGWKTLVIGGVENGESKEEAIAREVKEETGYQDIKLIRKVGPEIHSKFFAQHKDVNRYGRFNFYLVELNSEKYTEPNPEEVENHDGLWLEKSEVEKFLSLDNHRYAWKSYLNGEEAYTEEGVLINSEEFNEVDNRKAIEEITNKLSEIKKGRKITNFRLRDWGISRQRYWGTPIPIIHCEDCGAIAVKEQELPVELPRDVKFGNGNPLETASDWLNVKCPKCGKDAKRESDTMDTFVNSSWYFLRYTDPKNKEKIFDSKKANYWCPVDQYIGGAEHACMHLIYFRFYTKFLADLGLINFREPAKRLFHQGMLHGEDGLKMSKSKGNVINPDSVSERYGIDTARYFLLSLSEPDKPRDWSEAGIQGSLRFVKKIFGTFDNIKIGESSENFKKLVNKTVKGVSEDIEIFKYRMATIKLKELFEAMSRESEASRSDLETCLKLLSPVCPHICEELWERVGNKGFISTSPWPEFDESLLKEKKDLIDLNDKLIETINEMVGKLKERGGSFSKICIYAMPFEMIGINAEKIEKDIKEDLEVSVYAVNDKKKYDPENKAKKAKPGMPALFIE